MCDAVSLCALFCRFVCNSEQDCEASLCPTDLEAGTATQMWVAKKFCQSTALGASPWQWGCLALPVCVCRVVRLSVSVVYTFLQCVCTRVCVKLCV